MAARKVWITWVLSLQIAVPLVLLAIRAATGRVEFYGWGWQMFSG